MQENWPNIFSKLRKRVESDLFSSRVFTSDLTSFVNWSPGIAEVADVVKATEVELSTPEMMTREMPVEVIFLSDYIREKNNAETEILIKKIAEAMKLNQSDYKYIYFIEEKLDKKIDITPMMDQNYARLKEQMVSLKPKVVVTLGSTVTNYLLKENLRLVSVHGKFLDLSLDDFKTKMVPIFHPEYLMVNPAMKKTVWEDLQKIMKFLGKS
ncbi:MAG: uracil-DNA glycosylase family protein [Bacteriovoracaceae bacterium]